MKEKEMEKLLKALANRRRLAIIHYLKREKEASVGDIAETIRLSFRATSKHLRVLAAADVVDCEQRSLSVFYHIAAPEHRVVSAVIALI